MAFVEGLKIPKNITKEQLNHITEVVYSGKSDVTKSDVMKSDLLFIFGCPDPRIWEVAYEIYSKGLVRDIVITGGYNSNPKMRMKNWNYGEVAESEVIKSKIIEYGIPEERIYIENESRNSYQNVVNALEIYDFDKIDSLIFISKEMAVGRQFRTLRKNIPSHISIQVVPYEAYLGEYRLDRNNWFVNPVTRDFVFDEYLRNILYADKGDISEVEYIDEGLEEYIYSYLEKHFAYTNNKSV
jgi:uncharacterized SAM-binding protein YcdF (DUF218 family)